MTIVTLTEYKCIVFLHGYAVLSQNSQMQMNNNEFNEFNEYYTIIKKLFQHKLMSIIINMVTCLLPNVLKQLWHFTYINLMSPSVLNNNYIGWSCWNIYVYLNDVGCVNNPCV